MKRFICIVFGGGVALILGAASFDSRADKAELIEIQSPKLHELAALELPKPVKEVYKNDLADNHSFTFVAQVRESVKPKANALVKVASLSAGFVSPGRAPPKVNLTEGN